LVAKGKEKRESLLLKHKNERKTLPGGSIWGGSNQLCKKIGQGGSKLVSDAEREIGFYVSNGRGKGKKDSYSLLGNGSKKKPHSFQGKD